MTEMGQRFGLALVEYWAKSSAMRLEIQYIPYMHIIMIIMVRVTPIRHYMIAGRADTRAKPMLSFLRMIGEIRIQEQDKH